MKRAIAMSADAAAAAFAAWAGLAIQFARHDVPVGQSVAAAWWIIPLAAGVTVPIFLQLGLYRAVLRYIVSTRLWLQTATGAALSAAVLFGGVSLLLFMDQPQGLVVPRAAFLWYGLLLTGLAGGSRLAYRAYIRRHLRAGRMAAAIYGAGSGGVQLLSAMKYDGTYAPLAFIDDDETIQGTVVQGLQVFAPGAIPDLVHTRRITAVLLAIPSLRPGRRAEIIRSLTAMGVRIRTIPSLTDLLTQKATFDDLQDPSIEDVMGRAPVDPDPELLDCCVAGRIVLVSGAGGSIGSELCRQIIARAPQRLVLYDNAESPLFEIQQELLRRIEMLEQPVELVTVLGSILDEERLREVLLHQEVESVFHAAAYKHVPLLEDNVLEGLRNNIIGTRRIVEASRWANCRSIVIVSTDKAVHPRSLMGASKRFAEIVVQALAASGGDLRTCAVRFGNVFGSSGSVVRTFRDQIRRGGPVTVTDPDATRFFMTIPEAAELVLQAGGLGRSGEVFVLDMGEPVRILDLAHRMIELAGLEVCDAEHPNGDIAITFTGLRPGEKIHEQLAVDGSMQPTSHPMIRQIQEQPLDQTAVLEQLYALETAIEQGDMAAAIRVLSQAVPEYTPSDRLSAAHLTECDQPRVARENLPSSAQPATER